MKNNFNNRRNEPQTNASPSTKGVLIKMKGDIKINGLYHKNCQLQVYSESLQKMELYEISGKHITVHGNKEPSKQMTSFEIEFSVY